jgi:hypothetical protein
MRNVMTAPAHNDRTSYDDVAARCRVSVAAFVCRRTWLTPFDWTGAGFALVEGLPTLPEAASKLQ